MIELLLSSGPNQKRKRMWNQGIGIGMICCKKKKEKRSIVMKMFTGKESWS